MADPVGASTPVYRRLRVYAFDPYMSTLLETERMNALTLPVRWEKVCTGPVGEYLEVIDYDPASACFYAPVNLDEDTLLAQDGYPPSEGNPQFHQQMVYAVCMDTIWRFEFALGRSALWSDRMLAKDEWDPVPVLRLRVYPHALRAANAYYSPEKKALLFGYFPASDEDPGGCMPGGMVFTCLSQDVVSHETTHALLDGMHRRFIEPSNPDVFAFHEAFADIVALLRHFSFADVLRDQIAKTRGDIAKQSLLGQLAQEFGRATGKYGALRDALGKTDRETKQWTPKEPDPAALQTMLEPHDRGSLLVAAVFDAFVSIYTHRVADLLRIASGGTGVLPAGDLHPDLVNRLAAEAAKSAEHVLTMCVRALDYCPPVDITFGEYLRALVTADSDLVRDDDRGYRTAMIEAFRRHGIYPRDVRTLSEESLRWDAPGWERLWQPTDDLAARLAELAHTWRLAEHRRRAAHDYAWKCRNEVHDWLYQRAGAVSQHQQEQMGLALGGKRADDIGGAPEFEVHSVRPAQRVGPDGQTQSDLIIEITQKLPATDGRPPFRGGCTLVTDLETGVVRYCIRKDICSKAREARQQAYQDSWEFGLMEADAQRLYGADLWWMHAFALLHGGLGEEVER